MKVRIEFCMEWNFLPHALRVSEEIIEHHSRVKEVTLVPSGGGVFTVEVDGQVLFSKKATGRFPNPGEVKDLIARAAV